MIIQELFVSSSMLREDDELRSFFREHATHILNDMNL